MSTILIELKYMARELRDDNVHDYNNNFAKTHTNLTRLFDKKLLLIPRKQRREALEYLVALGDIAEPRPSKNKSKQSYAKKIIHIKEVVESILKFGHSDPEVVEEYFKLTKLKISKRHVGRIRRQLGIQSVNKRGKPPIVDDNEFIQHFRAGMTDQEIAAKYSVSRQTVNRKRNKLRAYLD